MLIRYECKNCGNAIEKILSNIKDVKGIIPCQCSGWLERTLSAPSSNSTETIDTGSNIKTVSFDRNRYDLAKQQGDDMLASKKKREEE